MALASGKSAVDSDNPLFPELPKLPPNGPGVTEFRLYQATVWLLFFTMMLLIVFLIPAYFILYWQATLNLGSFASSAEGGTRFWDKQFLQNGNNIFVFEKTSFALYSSPNPTADSLVWRSASFQSPNNSATYGFFTPTGVLQIVDCAGNSLELTTPPPEGSGPFLMILESNGTVVIETLRGGIAACLPPTAGPCLSVNSSTGGS